VSLGADPKATVEPTTGRGYVSESYRTSGHQDMRCTHPDVQSSIVLMLASLRVVKFVAKLMERADVRLGGGVSKQGTVSYKGILSLDLSHCRAVRPDAKRCYPRICGQIAFVRVWGTRVLRALSVYPVLGKMPSTALAHNIGTVDDVI
jgi:hypothetical protein